MDPCANEHGTKIWLTISLYLVGEVLGHQQACTTERYAHLPDDPLRAVADAESITAQLLMAECLPTPTAEREHRLN